MFTLLVFLISNPLFKVTVPDDDGFGPESEDDDDEPFSSVTVPPVVKTVVHNGRTLVYRIQDSGIEQEKPSAPTPQPVSHSDGTTLP
jgi:hypothetical protein